MHVVRDAAARLAREPGLGQTRAGHCILPDTRTMCCSCQYTSMTVLASARHTGQSTGLLLLIRAAQAAQHDAWPHGTNTVAGSAERQTTHSLRLDVACTRCWDQPMEQADRSCSMQSFQLALSQQRISREVQR